MTSAYRLPVWDTVVDSYRFIVDHRADLVKIGWLPLVLLFAVALAFSPEGSSAADPRGAESDLQALGIVLSILLQGSIATVMLVAWHRLVMRDYVSAAPGLRGGQASTRRASLYFIKMFVLSLLFVVVLAIGTLLAAIVLHGINFFIIEGGAPLDAADRDAKMVAIGYAALMIGLLPAFYVTFRLALALPATAVDRSTGFDEAWEASKGNGWRMVAATILVMLPVEAASLTLNLTIKSVAGTIWIYPLFLAVSAVTVVLIAGLGTVLSKSFAMIMSSTAPDSPYRELAPAAG